MENKLQKVYINSIGTALPTLKVAQQDIAKFMNLAMQNTDIESRKLNILYQKTQIKFRHSVIADYALPQNLFTFYPKTENFEPFPTLSQRMRFYEQQAAILAKEAILYCCENDDLREITHIITISCTGMYAPGLDIDLVNSLGLNTTVKRSSINFMGCYAAFNGLKLAQSICLANTQAKVLMVSVELCTLHFQKEKNESNLLSNALFADGAAAVLLSSMPNLSGHSIALTDFHCDLYPEAAHDMRWTIGNLGFEMLLTDKIPKTIQSKIFETIYTLLKSNHLSLENIAHFAIHPGGKAILEAIEKALSISRTQNEFSYDILENYGNMSSATVLFVLKKHLEYSNKGNLLSCAFGPGLTLETMLLEIL